MPPALRDRTDLRRSRDLRCSRHAATSALVVPLVAALAAPAAAQPAAEPTAAGAQPAPRFDIGFRVGGYGFKREGDSRPGAGWTECRMDGVGVFASQVLRGPLFLEAGLDVYTSSDIVLSSPSTDLPIDRMSGLISVAVGARTHLTSWLRGYVQLGAGIELTRLSVPYGDEQPIRASKILPEGFVGAGIDLRVARATYLGATFRTLVMGNFDYDRMRLDPAHGWVAPPPASEVFDASPDLAAQGQFYLRREL